MGPAARREYIADARRRYAAAKSRIERGRLLDAVVEATGYHRKYAIAVLRGRTAPRGKRARTGPRCGPAVEGALIDVWSCAGYPWSVRLRALLPLWLAAICKRHELSNHEQTALQTMSARTMDRILRKHRGALRKRLYGRTKPGTMLKHQIPIRSERWSVAEPGWFEVDSVAHCGTESGGEFIWSINVTDIATGWTQTLAVQGKGQLSVLAALDRIRLSLPFPILGLDSDSGSEFINRHCANWCLQHHIVFTRSRPYRKNDNAHIEQKNFTHVRKVFGYKRLEGRAALALMNALYECDLSLWMNYFQPSVKLVSKVRVGSRVRRHYDAALTPLDRLVALGLPTAAELNAKRFRLDPFALGEQIERQVKAVLEMPDRIVHAARRGPDLRALSHRQVVAQRAVDGGSPGVRFNATR